MENHISNNQDLLKLRHSCEHVLMEATEKLYPGILQAMGPATQDGFYFDFDLPEGLKISESDFPAIEKEMQAIIDQNLVFLKKEVNIVEARELFANNSYKQEWHRVYHKHKPTGFFGARKVWSKLCWRRWWLASSLCYSSCPPSSLMKG